MEKCYYISYVISPLLLFFFVLQTAAVPTQKSYIVYLGSHSFGPNPSIYDVQLATESQYDILGSVKGSKVAAKDSILYSYNRYINGFAAVLDDQEATALAKNPSVVSIFENKERKLHTTRSWSFLGVDSDRGIPRNSIWKAARFGEDTIIGNLDTGVWPESPSFNDAGYGPVPARWRGACDGGSKFRCNRKLIGARYFYRGFQASERPWTKQNISFDSAQDHEGHGSHTLSTAGGNFVHGVNVFGNGNGTAKGGSPRARVVAYKVCWPSENGGCYDSDILAGIEAAISDGVDVLSASLGMAAQEFAHDAISIGAFHAVQHGIVVVCSAGNDGPSPGSVSNVSPWMVTVGASTIDRDFVSYVALGNKKQLRGSSLSSSRLPAGKFYPLIKAVQVKAANATDGFAQLCMDGTLDPTKAKGKIIVCLRGENARVSKGFEVHRVGGIGMVLVNNQIDGSAIVADPHILPASHLSDADGVSITQYLSSTKTPVASITHASTEMGIKPSPLMASFSSRGPDFITEAVIKPDITAPGVNIIASVTNDITASGLPFDKRRVPFNIESGTSMSCPHISGVAGLLKTLHPTWSPGAIKSAIMTTAKTRDNTKNTILDYTKVKATPFDYGAGHVHPNNAMDPGLVYDTTVDDYLNFLCTRGYNSRTLKKFSNKPFVCAKNFATTDFNYPSILVPRLQIGESVTVNRRVKNVGSAGTYVARVKMPKGITVMVEPSTLQFHSVGEEKPFKLVFHYAHKLRRQGYVFGALVWSDGKHFVRSSIAVNLV
ncbi:subtilisin-like protease SBT5.3 [Cucurbita moschata]|uniref:Subtilisin-like protease SBT5.3 n=1 Tax=Cucurbita moschata TaxID=3662 RepID=A0A6J1GDW2_CUCMO|nr:subtilisin-like protease SBT5.3 [Cucurbita moschata]